MHQEAKKHIWLSLLHYFLYCSGLERNQQYLPCISTLARDSKLISSPPPTDPLHMFSISVRYATAQSFNQTLSLIPFSLIKSITRSCLFFLLVTYKAYLQCTALTQASSTQMMGTAFHQSTRLGAYLMPVHFLQGSWGFCF